jgi:serine/threonine protein kinase/Tol biopolymer transport system component
MPLSAGKKLGPYEIVSAQGMGGMGEVYRARDTRLDRIVAIKILRADFSQDEDRRRRFEREARTVSSLDHPHICPLYDIGHEDGVDFLVMQYLEGETLAERLKRGPLPFKDALRIAIDITEALESAHRRGVIHRDLKPANVMLTKFGAKLMDFGLARLRPERAAVEMSDGSATLARSADEPITGEGRIIGTMRYMAPEQIEGQEADARTDIFAAGLLIYEMVTGRNAFEGKTSAEVIAATLKTEPAPISPIASDPSGSLDRIVRSCIAKKPEDRWQDAHDLTLALKWISESATASSASLGPTLLLRRASLGWTAAALLGIAALAFALAPHLLRRAPPPKQVIRFSLQAPQGVTMEEPFWSHPVLSPDGRWVAFIAYQAGRSGLWTRALDSLTPEHLEQTEGALAPFCSPDSRWIGFFAENKVRKIAISGGPPQDICDAPSLVASGSWGANDTILFALGEAPIEEGLYRVSANGGQATRLRIQSADNREVRWPFFPQFFPDGKQFFFVDANVEDALRLYLGNLRGIGDVSARLVGPLVSRAEYDASGYVLMIRENTLVAQKFDPSTASFHGESIPMIENVLNFGGAAAPFSLSQNGVLLYQPMAGATSQLEWFDRTGRPLGTIGEAAQYIDLAISPDGQRLAATIADPNTSAGDIWIFPLPDGNATRLTSESTDEFFPIWSPDGHEIAFSSSKEGTPSLYRMRLGDSEMKVLVPKNGHLQFASNWLADRLVYQDRDPDTGPDIWSLAFAPDAKPIPIVRTKFREIHSNVSPNGRWIAYASSETGQYEVYIQPFGASGATGEKLRISSSGGVMPRWRGDAKEIFYLDLSSAPAMMAVGLDLSTGRPTGTPVSLFQLRTQVQHYDVARDGQRFLVSHSVDAAQTPAMHIVVNWLEGIRQTQGTK